IVRRTCLLRPVYRSRIGEIAQVDDRQLEAILDHIPRRNTIQRTRKPDVKKNKIWAVCLKIDERFLPTFTNVHDFKVMTLQFAGNILRDESRVFNNQYADLAHVRW